MFLTERLQEEMYYGTLALVSADNPASSGLGGFKEGNCAYRYCHHCLGTAVECVVEVDVFENILLHSLSMFL